MAASGPLHFQLGHAFADMNSVMSSMVFCQDVQIHECRLKIAQAPPRHLLSWALSVTLECSVSKTYTKGIRPQSV